MKLQHLITADRIRLDVKVETAEMAIEYMVSVLAESNSIQDASDITEKVLKREHQVGTGIGYGVAIPHADPGPYGEPQIVMARTEQPIDFHAPDGTMAQLIFLLLTPDETPALHVRLLARICRLTKSETVRKQLLNAKNSKDAAKKITNQKKIFRSFQHE